MWKDRRKVRKEGVARGIRYPHLAPSLIDAILEADDVLEFADVGPHGDHVRLSELRHELLRHFLEVLFVPVCDRDFQAQPKYTNIPHQIQVSKNSGRFKRRVIEDMGDCVREEREDTDFANSLAAAAPIPLAAPVTTATLPL